MRHAGAEEKNLQRGMTLIELIIAMLITSIILSGIGGLIYQVLTNNARTSAHMTAVKHVEAVLFFMVKDIQMAQAGRIQSDDGSLTLGWIDWDNTEHVVTYTVQGNGDLLRQYDFGSQTTIAKFIADLDTVVESGQVTVTVSSVIQGRWPATETRTMQVMPRAGS
jgi:prepilin-type N-terminal cleavage/methylation domain-containing protein